MVVFVERARGTSGPAGARRVALARVTALLALSLTACAANRAVTRDELIARHTAAVGGARAIESVERLEIEVRISEGGSQLEGAWHADRQGRMRIDVSAGGRRVYTEAYDGKRTG